MPTAAKLAALLLFGALTWGASQLAIPYVFEEGQSPGRFAEINAALGALLGWRMVGSRAGWGWAGGMGAGLTAALCIAVSLLFLHSFAVMIRQSLRRIYDGPVEGLADVFAMMVRTGALLVHPGFLVTVALGAVVAGLLTEWVGRNAS